MNADDVFDLLVEANPVRDPGSRPSTPHERNDIVHTMNPPIAVEPPSRPNHRKAILVAVAAALLLAVGIGIGAAVGDRSGSPTVIVGDERSGVVERPPEVVDPGPTVEERATDTLSPLADRAVDVAGGFAAAMFDGDVETMLPVVHPTLADAEHERGFTEMHGVYADAGYPTQLRGCVVQRANELSADVRCDFALTYPIAIATGESQGSFPMTVFEDGTVVPHAWNGIDVTPLNRAPATWLRTNAPDDYARSCDPAGQDRQLVMSSDGLVLDGACAQVVVQHMDGIVTWIEAGQPDLSSGS